jgi:hypothetical protein
VDANSIIYSKNVMIVELVVEAKANDASVVYVVAVVVVEAVSTMTNSFYV